MSNLRDSDTPWKALDDYHCFLTANEKLNELNLHLKLSVAVVQSLPLSSADYRLIHLVMVNNAISLLNEAAFPKTAIINSNLPN